MSNYSRNKIKGATMIEYVLIVGLISIAAVALLTALGVSIQGLLTRVSAALTGA